MWVRAAWLRAPFLTLPAPLGCDVDHWLMCLDADVCGGIARRSKDAQEMWNSSHMSINHFKDDNYSLVRREMEVAVQAVPLMVDTAIQATGACPIALSQPTAASLEGAPLLESPRESIGRSGGPRLFFP